MFFCFLGGHVRERMLVGHEAGLGLNKYPCEKAVQRCMSNSGTIEEERGCDDEQG